MSCKNSCVRLQLRSKRLRSGATRMVDVVITQSESIAEAIASALEHLPLPSLVGGRRVAVKQAKRRPAKRWVREVTTDSTHPPPRTFTGSASEIARKMARRDVSPKGLGSGIRMIQYFINRGGKNLSATRRAELERAKRILQRRAAGQKAATKKR